jgi:large subunit ribosomal protein L30
MKKLRITQFRSTISRPQNQRDTLRSLGIRGLHKPVVQDDSPAIRGMVATVRHLIHVEEIKG